MRVVSVDSLSEGMVLSRDLSSPSGRLILTKGSVIKEHHVNIMRCWGISEASIVDDSSDSSEEFLARPSGLLSQEVKDRFSLWPDSDLKEAFMSLAPEYNVVSWIKGLSEENFLNTAPISLEELLSNEPGLVGFSPVLSRILQVLSSPSSSATHIAQVISNDSSMSFKLLKLVNSPLYGFPRKINSITQAVSIIGNEDLIGLAMQISSISYFKNVPRDVISMEAFWKDSICSAIFSRLLASRHFRENDSHYFVGGMFLRLGRLILLRHMPNFFLKSMEMSYRDHLPLLDCESTVLGYNSNDIAMALFDRWLLPSKFERTLFMRYDPYLVFNDLDANIFHLSDVMGVAFGSGFSGDYYIPVPIKGAFSKLGYSLNDLPLLLSQFKRQRDDIIDVFLGDERL